MERGAKAAKAAAGILAIMPVLAVLAFAAWLTWPVARGVMPLSADHTVHLTRIVLTAERLVTTGAISGWDPTWFFGFPLGDLYPQLGDLLIIAIRGLCLGLIDWPTAYALGFFVVFALQGLVLVRIGRLFGFGPWPGLIAAFLMLGDPGFTREGGWMYTVYFGVWPQALATSLAWLGLGELVRALGWTEAMQDPPRERATMLAGLCFGAALLAHPIALPTLGIGGLLLIVTLVPRAAVPWRDAVASCLLAGAIGAALAAWWWVPMIQHKAWMASYGWLFAPFEAMSRWLLDDGRWAQRMPAAVGYLALAGVALGALGAGRGVARFVALFALVQWLLASTEAFWLLRLDRFSEGFTHIQYQRFLIGAKPGLYLCAGLVATLPGALAWRLISARESLEGWRRSVALVAAIVIAPGSLGLCWWLADDSRAAMAEHEVGAIQTQRDPNHPELDADYAQFVAWLREQWDAREHDYRIAAQAPRDSHVFMDAPVWSKTPQYKLGFTPGDNFVHKPESSHGEILDKLGVRWMVGLDRGRPSPRDVARFGRIHVREYQPRGQRRGLAWLEGGGSLELLEADLRRGLVRLRASGIEDGARLVFAIAGYPRWKLSLDGEPIEWFEDPVRGDAAPASLEMRRSGELRGGKARGDDGREPTLIAAELPPGTDGAIVELRYDERGGLELAAELCSLIAWLGLAVALARGRGSVGASAWVFAGLERARARLVAWQHPLVLMIVIPALLGLGVARWKLARADEADALLGWVEAGAAKTQRVETGPVKAEMLIRPAVIMRPRPGKPAQVEVALDRLPDTISGWVGIDDDQARQPGRWGLHEISIQVRWSGSPDSKWYEITGFPVQHQPERVVFEVDTGPLKHLPVILRITDETDSKRIPRLGLDLELGQVPADPATKR